MASKTEHVCAHTIPLFQDLSPRDLGKVKNYLREKDYEKGEMIFFEGDPCQQIFIIQSGRVKIFRTSSAGKEQILEVLEKGDTCACNPGVPVWNCFASAQAVTPCRLWIFPRRNYDELIKSNHKLTSKLNQIFADRVCRLCSLVEEVSLKDPDKRIVKFLLDMAKQDKKTGPKVMSFTHEEISQRLGLVRETVTRHLQRLKKLKLIDIKPSRILILQEEKLKEILNK